MTDSFHPVISLLVRKIEHLERVVARQSTRLNNLVREGKVLEVDYEKGLAIIDAHGLETNPSPWLQRAGDIVDWDPLAVGQRVVFVSPSGDPGRGFILPGGYTDDVPQPYTSGASFGRTVGGTKIFGDGSSYTVETGTFTIKGNLVIEGSVLTHNGKNVGHDHEHTLVVRGLSNSGPPA